MKKRKLKVRKYQEGGEMGLTDPNQVVATGGSNPTLTENPGTGKDPLDPKVLKAKYKDNPYLVGNQNRYFWATQTNREFPITGGNVKEAVINAANLNKLDPALLYSSAMEEGMSGAIDTENWVNISEAYGQFEQKNPDLATKFPVDGFYNYGLDQFAGQAKMLEEKGYLPKGFSSNFTTFDAVNEKNEKLKAPAFNTDANALVAKSAMLRLAQDQLDEYTRKTGIQLTDRQKEFFLLANYNAGVGNMQKMIDSYKQKGYLKDDKFLEPTFRPASYAGVYDNVQARLQAASVLRNEGIFKYGGKMPKRPKGVPKYTEGGEPGSKPTPRDIYYQSSAKLAYYKNILNEKLKAKNPEAFSNYFKGLTDLRRAGKSTEAAKYIQNTPYNEYLSVDEVKATLGDKYEDYLDSLRSVNAYNVQQGQQPLYGQTEGENDISKLNYGRRFASLQVTPSVSVTNIARNTTYNRNYTYDPEKNIVTFVETGDLSLRPSDLLPPSTMEKGGRIPKYQDGTGDPIDPIIGQPKPAQLTNKLGVDVWQNAANTPVPINPNAPINEQIFPIDPQQQNPQNQQNIVPLSQMYEYERDRFGNEVPVGTGRYVDFMGNPNTLQDQQAEFDLVSDLNRLNSERREKNIDNAEFALSAGMTAINSYFNKQNSAQQRRADRRSAIMQEVEAFKLNPYLEGTGSQAIMKKGGKIHIKPENRGKFTAAAKRAGKSVQAYAAQIMANPDNYSPTLRKRANFARNAAKWHEFGGEIDEIQGDDLGIQTLDGGKSKLISSSNHSNPMVEFSGKEHKQGGIGIQYGGNVAEVEDKEVGWIDAEGGLNIFGKLKLPGTNQTFRKAAKDIAKQESKVDGMKSKYLNILNNGDPTDPYQESAQSTAKVMFKSLDKQSRKIAEKKEALADYQNLILTLVQTQQVDNDMNYGGKMPKKPYAYGGIIPKMPSMPSMPKIMQNGGDLPPGAYLDKTGFHNPMLAQSLMNSILFMPRYTNFNTGDFEMNGSIQRVPKGTLQSPNNFNTGDYQHTGTITQVPRGTLSQPITTNYGFNTGDFQFTGQVKGKRVPNGTLNQNSPNYVPFEEPLLVEPDFRLEGGVTETRKVNYKGAGHEFSGTIKGTRRVKMEEGGELNPNDPKSIQSIIDKYSGGKAPLKAEDFIEVSKKYGVPLDLMLAQAIQESNIGTKGRAVRTKNIFNVGNTDDGTESHNDSWKAGLERYAKLIRDEYSKDPNNVTTQEILMNDFIRPGRGGRYATDPMYTSRIASILNKINPGNNYSYNNVSGGGSGAASSGSNNAGTGSGTGSGNGLVGSTTNTSNLYNFNPVYRPIGNSGAGAGAGVVNTKYGAARREATPFSDRVNIGKGNKERGYLSPLAMEQIAPELLTIATNRQDAVPQLSYQPDLKQTFDISYQLGRNENQSSFNQIAKIAEQTGNVDALSQLAAQKYKADEAYNMQEIQGNAAQRLNTYSQNVDVLNDAKLKNLALIADQQIKQAQAKFNTRKEDLSAFTSISGKVLQNRLENITYNAYANLFKHYGFDKKGNVTFNADDVVQRFSPGEAQQFGFMAAQQGANAIMNGDFSRRFTRVKNDGGGTTTTETLGTNKKIQEEYKALKSQGFDDNIIGNMLRAKYPQTITQD